MKKIIIIQFFLSFSTVLFSNEQKFSNNEKLLEENQTNKIELIVWNSENAKTVRIVSETINNRDISNDTGKVSYKKLCTPALIIGFNFNLGLGGEGKVISQKEMNPALPLDYDASINISVKSIDDYYYWLKPDFFRLGIKATRRFEFGTGLTGYSVSEFSTHFNQLESATYTGPGGTFSFYENYKLIYNIDFLSPFLYSKCYFPIINREYSKSFKNFYWDWFVQYAFLINYAISNELSIKKPVFPDYYTGELGPPIDWEDLQKFTIDDGILLNYSNSLSLGTTFTFLRYFSFYADFTFLKTINAKDKYIELNIKQQGSSNELYLKFPGTMDQKAMLKLGLQIQIPFKKTEQIYKSGLKM